MNPFLSKYDTTSSNDRLFLIDQLIKLSHPNGESLDANPQGQAL